MKLDNATYRDMADAIWHIRCELKSRGVDPDIVAKVGEAYDEVDWLDSQEDWLTNGEGDQ